MAKFCTGCGAQVADDGRFCEQCGKPVAAAALTPSAIPVETTAVRTSASKNPAGRKLVLLIGGAAAILIAGGGAAYMAIRDSGPPSASGVTELIQVDKKLVETLTCLDNFDYSLSSVNVSPWDLNTQSWLSVLVDAGLYTGPARFVSGGFMPQEHLRYEQTENGKKAVHGKRLCYADGVMVDSVKYDEPPPNANPPRASGSAKYHLVQPAAWISKPAAKEALPQRFAKESLEISLNLVLLDGKWQPLDGAARALNRRSPTNAGQSSPKESNGGSLFGWLGNLLNGDPGRAVQGRWTATGGFVPVVLEFKSESAVVMGAEIPAKYVREGDMVVVRVSSPLGGDSLKLKVVSNDELRLIDDSPNGLRLVRSN